ncbi:MAG: hypothetical protein K8T25_13385 [Planctomycetia bacterium]|nr:hypothetical protein [Planctomycetia bacterium]
MLLAAVVLPIAIAVVYGAAALLGAMRDDAAAVVLSRVALCLGLAWILDLVLLVIVLGIQSLGGNSPTGTNHSTAKQGDDFHDLGDEPIDEESAGQGE